MLLGSVAKQPGESFKIGADFARRLDTGEALAGQTATSKTLSDGLDTTAALLTQAAVSGSLASVRLKVGGTVGQNHRVQMRVISTLGNTYEGEVDVLIRET